MGAKSGIPFLRNRSQGEYASRGLCFSKGQLDSSFSINIADSVAYKIEKEALNRREQEMQRPTVVDHASDGPVTFAP